MCTAVSPLALPRTTCASVLPPPVAVTVVRGGSRPYTSSVAGWSATMACICPDESRVSSEPTSAPSARPWMGCTSRHSLPSFFSSMVPGAPVMVR